uniref:UPF0183 protein CG7083 n=1 Tax=Schistocephalus solidus TaxID=70667 RepID=A0A0X3Q4Z6_SCHSO
MPPISIYSSSGSTFSLDKMSPRRNRRRSFRLAVTTATSFWSVCGSFVLANGPKKLAFDLIYQELCVNPNRDPPIQRFSACVAFGDTVQDVLSALGSPSRIFYKTEDKMKIHLPQSYRQIRQRHSDFFYNYFTLGLDVLFDSHTHTVISFVLHTNLPGEYTFNTYYRCMFEIPLEEVEGGKGLTVTPFTKWSEIKLHLLDAIDAEPVVIHRETKPPKNPYGSTHAYGYQDIIFEVLPQNDYLGSVTLFSLPKNM